MWWGKDDDPMYHVDGSPRTRRRGTRAHPIGPVAGRGMHRRGVRARTNTWSMTTASTGVAWTAASWSMQTWSRTATPALP